MKNLLLCLAAAAMCGVNPSSFAASDWKPAEGPLKTRWAADVSPENAHPEYPRPQFVRQEWANLNGLWDYAITPKEAGQPDAFQGQILVPFPIESALSGVMKRVSEAERIWYKRAFQVPREWKGKRLLLHFGAVDFETTVWVNGVKVGEHRGGYTPFTFEITGAIEASGLNEMVVAVWDPTDAGTQPRGKQIRNPHGIWYTPTSGIWQTVWLEPVGSVYLSDLKITPDIDKSVVRCEPVLNAALQKAEIEYVARDRSGKFFSTKAPANKSASLSLGKARLWSPENPHLYSLTVRLKLGGLTLDTVTSYFGMRKISLGKDELGFTRLLLNNKPYFQFGPLDQGFWPDGLYTAPTDEALRFDIEKTKELGFNMARKHVKVEPARWYYWCDTLGLLVWQDMPSGDKYIGARDNDITRSSESAKEFEAELEALVSSFYNSPSIVMWVPYNEGWGQWDTARITRQVKDLDPTRLVNNASGWTDRGVGDVNDIHRYPGPGAPEPEEKRAGVLGEFGGLGLPLKDHTWQSEKNWGYRSFTDVNSLTDAYLDLLAKLFPLIESKGLSAAVYTQTTDVEVEVNGLMTYDRAVMKLDPKRIGAANRGKVPARAKATTREVAPSAQTGKPEWRYTIQEPPDGWFLPEYVDSQWKQGVAGFGTSATPAAIVRTEWSGPQI